MRPGSTANASFGARAFRALLHLYPGAFRDDYGRELSLVFLDRYRDATGAWDRIRLWFEAAAGILADAPREHARMTLRDLREAWRALRAHAGVTAAIVLTLGVGIGADAAVFSLFNAVALRSSSAVPGSGALYAVNTANHAAAGPEGARLSGPQFVRLQAAATDEIAIAAMSRGIARVYTRVATEQEPAPASLQLVSPGYFRTLGVTAALGRLFPDDGGGPAAGSGAVISYSYWQRRFGSSPDVAGRLITINGSSFTIVGVAARGFTGVWLETPVDIWVPLTAQPLVKYTQSFTADGADLGRPWLPQAGIWWLHVVARVPAARTGAVAERFNSVLATGHGAEAGVQLQPFARGLSRFRQQFTAPLVVLLVMATLALLAACANTANLLMARAIHRRRELAVRMALGAGRARIFHQLLIESLLIVVLAAAAGLVFVRWTADVILRVAIAASDGYAPLPVPIDWRVLTFAAATAFVSVLVFGVWPAWRATRVDPVEAFRTNARTIAGAAGHPARALVVLQVTLSSILIVATGLLARSFQELIRLDPGVEPTRVLAVGIDPRLAGLTAGQLPAAYERIVRHVTDVPGVTSAALAMCGVQTTCAHESAFQVEGYQPNPGEDVEVSMNIVTPRYFATLGVPLLAGRVLNDDDRERTTHVAVVNRTLAERYLGGSRQALGRHVGAQTPDVEIVGVVDDMRELSRLKSPAGPSVFVPLAQHAIVPRQLTVRTSVEPATVSTAVRRALSAAAPGLPIESMEPAVVYVQRGLSQERVVLLVAMTFGLLTLGLAAFGLFGLLSYVVARRAPEIGVRLALGAAQSQVAWTVVRDASRLVLYGLLISLPLSALAGSLASGMIYGVSPYDPVAFAAAVVLLMVVAAAASWGPARRASRVDPMVALRQE